MFINIFKNPFLGPLRIRERIKKENERQTERLESLGRLAGGVAHDFNNFLMVIGLNIAAAAEIDEPLERQELIAMALESIRQSRGLTRQLMTFSRGGEPLRPHLGRDAEHGQRVDERARPQRERERPRSGGRWAVGVRGGHIYNP